MILSFFIFMTTDKGGKRIRAKQKPLTQILADLERATVMAVREIDRSQYSSILDVGSPFYAQSRSYE
jgi:hypothetical protein